MKNKSHIFLRILLGCYLVFLLKVIVFKGTWAFLSGYFRDFHLVSSIKTGYSHANFIPVKTLYYYFSLQENAQTGLQNIGGNILLFIPYGILLSMTFAHLRYSKKIITVVFVTSLLLELIQLVLALGNFDVDDLLLNTFGGITGYGVYLVFSSKKNDNPGFKN